MQEQSLFDRRLRRWRRDRAWGQRAHVDYLYRLFADELLDRLDLITRPFKDALILGASIPLEHALRNRGIGTTCVDAGFQPARESNGVQCDEDLLPFAPNSFDLILSPGGLDSVNDLPGALSLIRRALMPDGLFLCAFAGAGSLPRLRDAMLAADLATVGSVSPRVHPQIDVRAAGDLLGRAGFAMPVADSHGLTIRFASLEQLIRDLRAFGGTNVLASRARRPMRRAALAAAASQFAAEAGEDGKVGERLEIVCLTGWAPAPGQPRPAPRGSGTVSLAAALNKPKPR